MDLKQKTPSKSVILNKISQMSCDSPFRHLPNVSTPPSRFTKIINPFEPHLLDRLHLPTFSPSVFAQISTPKNETKFGWSIDNISSLKPADIDEDSVSRHVSNHDPTVESLIQDKIDKFFNEKAIVPSPLSEEVKNASLPPRENRTVASQTLLTLPPVLPRHVADALAPYFHDEQDDNEKLYRELFEFDEQTTPASSPALSTGLSPIQFSPEFATPMGHLESTIERATAKDCTLSPIMAPSPLTRSACRLSFSGHMSVDGSLLVPDINRTLNYSALEKTPPAAGEEASDLSMNWDIEYKHVSLLSPTSSPEVLDGNSDTPHSKIFTSQRKRLSDSFKNEDERDVDMEEPKRLKEDDTSDGGYFSHVFASTPTKRN